VQVSIIVFLLHGYIGNAIVMLRRTAIISGAISLFDALIKAVLIWGLGVPLYKFGGSTIGDPEGDMTWSKWGFWMMHAMVFAAAYLVMLVLPFTKWRDLLPSKDTFHYYVRILFTVNLVRCLPQCLNAPESSNTCLERGAKRAREIETHPQVVCGFFIKYF
jgi:Predicted membrane protein